MISFNHAGGESMASYRLRARLPASLLGAVNDPAQPIQVFAKPIPPDVEIAKKFREQDKFVITDICDPHLDQRHYRELVDLSHAVTCNTEWMKTFLMDELGREIHVIPDVYEADEFVPHCSGDRILWFGNAINLGSLKRVEHHLKGHPVTVLSNATGFQWSPELQHEALLKADIVVMPETAPYKSANRTIEAIRYGCCVIAEPHPSLDGFPIYKGNIKRGIEWAIRNPEQANDMTLAGQDYVRKLYSPRILENAWKTIMTGYGFTWDQAESTGTDG